MGRDPVEHGKGVNQKTTRYIWIGDDRYKKITLSL